MKTRNYTLLSSKWKKAAVCGLFSLSCCFNTAIQAQVAEWTFENISSAVPSTPIAASSKIPQVRATASLSGGKNNGSPDVCSGSETWSTNFWPTGNSRSTGDYIEFMLRADPGEFIDITRFAFTSSASSNNSALQFEVHYSLNNFTTSRLLFSGTHSIGGCGTKGGSLSTTVLGNSHIRFRIYPYGQNVAAQAATIRLDNVRISGAVLPVTLNSFRAVQQEDQVLLEWATTSEINNDYFAVERSLDGLSFQEIGQVPGKGNSQSEQTYQFSDRQVLLGTVYYRLKQVDFDGTATYHPIEVVDLKGSLNNESLRLYPTIAQAVIQIELGFQPDKSIPFTIYSLQGRPLKGGLIKAQTLPLDVSELPAGAYLLRVMKQDRPYVARFMKQ